MTQEDKLYHFETNVQLKSIIGKDLINNDNIAVLELVKNSFDAGSLRVEVEFKNLIKNDDNHNGSYSGHSSKILIKDSGSGMNFDDLTGKWLNIAFSAKKQERKSGGQILAGEKGVGRFSCDRLGKYLDLYTRKNGGQLYHIYIDWSAFEIEDRKDKKIQDVNVKLEEFPREHFQEKFGFELEYGTLLEISKLRSPWVKQRPTGKYDTRKLLDLRRYLEKLINPNQSFQAQKFEIILIARDFEDEDSLTRESKKVNGLVKNRVFEKLDFTTTVIEAVIDSTGETIQTSITDKKRKIFTVLERNIDYNLLSGIRIIIFYLNPYAKAYFKRETGIRPVDFGSIFLFINGFRVNPLGDNGDDWLRMEVRKGQGHAKFLGTREVIGRIEIDDQKQRFKIISSREGVVKDERFEQLVSTQPSSWKGFFYKTLKRLEKYVVGGLDWDKSPLGGIAIEKLVESAKWEYDPSSEKYLENQTIKDKRVLGLLSSMVLLDTSPANIISLQINPGLITQVLADKDEKTRERFNKLFSQKKLFSKDILDPATWNTLDNLRRELEKTREKLVAKEKKVIEQEQQLEILHKQKRKSEIELKKEREKSGQLQSIAETQEKRIYFLKEHVEASKKYAQVISLFHQLGISAINIETMIVNFQRRVRNGNIDDNKILNFMEKVSIENKKIKTIAALATKANLSFDTSSLELKNADLTNYIIQYIGLVSGKEYTGRLKIHLTRDVAGFYSRDFNALDIVMMFDNLFDNANKAGASEITIEVISSNRGLTIKVRDNGSGIPSENVDKIFDFGFSTTHGTGVGLFHVREIVKKLGGNIKLNQNYPKGCEFIIEVKNEINV